MCRATLLTCPAAAAAAAGVASASETSYYVDRIVEAALASLEETRAAAERARREEERARVKRKAPLTTRELCAGRPPPLVPPRMIDARAGAQDVR